MLVEPQYPSMIYIDMDRVLVDFDKAAKEVLGDLYDPTQSIGQRGWDILVLNQEFYKDLPMMVDAPFLLEYLHQKFIPQVMGWRGPGSGNIPDVAILTALPKLAHFPQAVRHKREWIHAHVGAQYPVFFGPYSEDKQWHCRPGDLLIDDSEMNIDQWRGRLGYGIVHKTTFETVCELDRIVQRFA